LHNNRLNSYWRIVSFLLLFSISTFAQSVSPEIFNGLKWRLIGPFRGGRAVAVTGVPGDSRTFYFGSVNGGIWKTTDAGVVWTPIFDGQPVGSIGALAVAPSSPDIIYAGTGESDIRSDLSSGNGVYKSVDAGRTWTHLGLDDTRQISRIVIDPNNADIVYVGALGHAYGPNPDRGVFKSLDGGVHWAKVLDQGPEIGVSDLAICSGNPNLLFAGTWHTHRPPWSTYAPIDGPGGGLFRSRDGGLTWTRLQGKGLPEGDWGRLGVAVAPDGRRLYALIPAGKPGLYRSDDGGDTWALVNPDPRLTSRAWYFSGITIDPQNRDVIYMPNVALFGSEDGGKTIFIVRGAPGGDDYHQIWIDPKNSSSMVLGTDQGTTISLDRGRTWSSWYNQPTAQLYHVLTDNKFPYTVYGAQQDTGSAAVPSRTDHGQITPRDWFPAGGSESGYMALDPSDPDIIYLSGTYGTVDRFNRRTGFSQNVTPWPVSLFVSDIHQLKYRAPWSPVLVSSPTDPKILYFGAQYVLKTADGGLHWQQISPDLTGAETESKSTTQGSPTLADARQRGYGIISTIAPSPRNRELIWAGSNTGLIHLTRDGGKSWKNVTPSGMSDWSEVSLIEASPLDAGVAYAAVDRSRVDDEKPYLYRTRDYGASWQPIVQGIPASAFLRAIREDPYSRGLLFAGTELGIYVSFDDGDHWQSLQLNLPVTSVRDLTIHGGDLVIATHGRSFWILDNITPLRQARVAAQANRPWLFDPAVATRIDNDAFVGTPLPPEEPTAPNPPSGAMIDYYLNAPAKEVKLEIFDGQQNLLRRFSSQDQASSKQAPVPIAERWLRKPQPPPSTAGMHRFVWDLIWGGLGSADNDAEADYRSPSGPKIVPGNYQVRLTVDGYSQTQALRIVMDPRSPATPAVLAQQFQLGKQMFMEALETRHALAEIGSVQKQLTEQTGSAARDAQLNATLTSAQSTLSKIADGKDRNADQGPGLADAYKNLASALRVVESGDRETPAQAIAVYQQSSKQIKECIGEWTDFKEKQLPQINERLRSANLPAITPRESE
jgi:photosystem II stability/assembly factor-like uncharacterized protein